MIGIVILNYKNYEVTQKCVKSILAHPPTERYKIYIIDNGSDNDSFSILQKEYSSNQIVVKRLEHNLGFAAGNDYGIRLCEQDGINYCILTNSDILFFDGTIDKMISTLKGKERAVIVGPKVYNGSDAQIVAHSSRLKEVRFIDPLEIGRLFPIERINEDKEIGVHKVYSVSGCCFAIDIDRFRQIGAFDTNTFLYNEENILGYQAKHANLYIYIDLDAYVIHDHGASSGKENDFIKTEYIKSTLYYWKRYRKANSLSLNLILLVYILKLKIQNHSNIHPFSILKSAKAYMKLLNSKTFDY